jgi:hypothetical protein
MIWVWKTCINKCVTFFKVSKPLFFSTPLDPTQDFFYNRKQSALSLERQRYRGRARSLLRLIMPRVNSRLAKKNKTEVVLVSGAKGSRDLLQKCFSLPKTPLDFSLEKKLEAEVRSSFEAEHVDSGKVISRLCGQQEP